MTKPATITVWITAVAWAAFGLWLAIDPTALPRAFGIDSIPGGLRTEIRAFYGGVEIAIGIVMLILLRSSELRASLLLGGATLLAAAVGRAVGMLIDGPDRMHLLLGSFEAVGAAANLWLRSRLPRGHEGTAA